MDVRLGESVIAHAREICETFIVGNINNNNSIEISILDVHVYRSS